MFDANGRLPLHLIDPDRKNLNSGDFLRPTAEELKEAFNGYKDRGLNLSPMSTSVHRAGLGVVQIQPEGIAYKTHRTNLLPYIQHWQYFSMSRPVVPSLVKMSE